MKRKPDLTLPPPNRKADDEDSEPRYTPKPQGSWRKLIGRAKDDDLSTEAYQRGAEWRARTNREGR